MIEVYTITSDNKNIFKPWYEKKFKCLNDIYNLKDGYYVFRTAPISQNTSFCGITLKYFEIKFNSKDKINEGAILSIKKHELFSESFLSLLKTDSQITDFQSIKYGHLKDFKNESFPFDKLTESFKKNFANKTVSFNGKLKYIKNVENIKVCRLDRDFLEGHEYDHKGIITTVNRSHTISYKIYFEIIEDGNKYYPLFGKNNYYDLRIPLFHVRINEGIFDK